MNIEMINLPLYANESWYKRMPESDRNAFNSWYNAESQKVQEIANIKDELFDACYNLKNATSIFHPSRIIRLIEKTREKIPSNLLTPNLKIRISELERKAQASF